MAEKKFLVHLNLNQNELIKAVVENQAIAPSNPKDGQIYYNTSTGTEGLYIYKDGAWKKLLDKDEEGNYVPTSRTINGKNLTSNITLYSTDIPVSSTDATTVKDYIDKNQV